MVGLSLFVEMESMSYIQLWRGETNPLAQHWNLYGQRMENMLLGKVLQGSKFTLKISRLVIGLV